MDRTMPEPARPVATAALIFDGECGICTRFADWTGRIDRRRRFTVVPYQDLDEPTLRAYRLNAADCAARLYVVEPWPMLRSDARAGAGPPARSPRAWGGARGVNVLLWRCFPWSLVVVALYLVPVLLIAEVILYRWVARHRATISRRLGLRGCRAGKRT